MAVCRFSTCAGVTNSDALIQEHYTKEITNSIGPVSANRAGQHSRNQQQQQQQSVHRQQQQHHGQFLVPPAQPGGNMFAGWQPASGRELGILGQPARMVQRR